MGDLCRAGLVSLGGSEASMAATRWQRWPRPGIIQPVLATISWALEHKLGSLEPRRSGLAYQRFRKLVDYHTQKLGW